MNKQFTIILIIFLGAFGYSLTGLFTKVLSSNSADFAVEETTKEFARNARFIVRAISVLICGILADIYGRRPVILLLLIIFTMASVLLAFFPNSINYLIATRLLEGIIEGTTAVLLYTCVRDLYSGSRFVKIISRLNILKICVVLIVLFFMVIIEGIIIGGGGSQGSLFVFLAISATIMLLIFFRCFEETLTKKLDCFEEHLTKRLEVKFTAKEFFKSYFQILKDKQFLAFSLMVALLGDLSLILSTGYDNSSELGDYVFVYLLAFIVGIFLNQAYVEKFGPKKLLLTGLILKIAGVGFGIVSDYLIDLTPRMEALIFIPIIIGTTLITNNAVMYALEHIPKDAIARASAIVLLLSLAFGGVKVYIVG